VAPQSGARSGPDRAPRIDDELEIKEERVAADLGMAMKRPRATFNVRTCDFTFEEEDGTFANHFR
jgi:hypothetical protein